MFCSPTTSTNPTTLNPYPNPDIPRRLRTGGSARVASVLYQGRTFAPVSGNLAQILTLTLTA